MAAPGRLGVEEIAVEAVFVEQGVVVFLQRVLARDGPLILVLTA